MRPDNDGSVAAKADASDATPEIAGLQEKYDIGAIDWAVVDASGTPEQTLEQCLPRVTQPVSLLIQESSRRFLSPVVAKQITTRHVIPMGCRHYRNQQARAPPAPGEGDRGGAARRRRSMPRWPATPRFGVIARRYLRDLTAHHEATCEGDADALHQMRIALTRLRATIAFFSPMVADPQRTRLANELKWLNAHLGAVRDLDVAIERLKEINKRPPQRSTIDPGAGSAPKPSGFWRGRFAPSGIDG